MRQLKIDRPYRPRSEAFCVGARARARARWADPAMRAKMIEARAATYRRRLAAREGSKEMGSITTIKEPSPAQFRVLHDISRERDRQDAKWGPQNHNPMEWISILLEEVGEVAKAANEAHWAGVDLAHYRTELIEVAAVAVAAVECLDRQKEPTP